MIAIGIDYGTTNSLAVVYQKDMWSRDIRKVHKASSVYSNGEYIRSPKRLLNDLQSNNSNTIALCIDNCVRPLLSDLRCKLTDDERSNIKLSITVPNAFKDNQCDLLKESLLRTFANSFNEFDLNSVEIIPEPIAAALYYVYCLKMKLGQMIGRKYIVVSDMGGGTTDLAVVRMEMKGGELHFKVVTSESDPFLGGDDIDSLIAKHLTSKYQLERVENKYILSAAQNLKKKLSINLSNSGGNTAESLLLLENDYYFKEGKELEMALDSDILESLLNAQPGKRPKGFLGTYNALLERLCNEFRRKLCEEEGYKDSDVDRIFREQIILLPIGGSSRLSFIRELFSKAFKGAPIFDLNTEVGTGDSLEPNYDSVVRGAAIYSAYRSGIISDLCNRMIIENRTLHNISVRYSSDKVYTCVKKSMPDDVYTSVFNPKKISPDGTSFTIGDLEFYQGESDSILDKDCSIKLCTIDDTIYTNGRQRDDIKIILSLKIVNGRLESGQIAVPNGNKDGSDYKKDLAFRKL